MSSCRSYVGAKLGLDLSGELTEPANLRRYLRDLVALSALPAIWVGQSPKLIVNGLTDALLRTLRADFVYARVASLSHAEITTEAVSTDRGPSLHLSPGDIGRKLEPWLESQPPSPSKRLPSPLGDGRQVALAVATIGLAGGALGVVAAGSSREDFASDYDRLLVRVGANQLAVALQGAQLQAAQAELEQRRRLASLLEQRVAERTRELESLYRADETLYASLRLDDVLRALAAAATDVLGTDKSIVFVPDESGQRLVVRVARGFGARTVAQLSLAHDEGIIGEVLRTKAPVSVANIHIDPRASTPAAKVLEPEGVHALLSVPIMARGEVIAVLNTFDADVRDFDEGQKRVVVALAQRAGLAIENARLYEGARTVATTEERQRMSRELHDSVSQALYGIALGARTAREHLERDPEAARAPLDYVLQLAEGGLAEMRAMIFELRPESLEKEGLVGALAKQAAALRARYGIRVDEVFDAEPTAPIAVKEALFRIAQEALNNTAKHARASHVELHLRSTGERLVAEIRDNGAGFDAHAQFPGHLGLQSMRERASHLGGDVEIISATGQGTLVRAMIPRRIGA